MKPAYIVDIDGTIANGDHRRHFVMNKPKNWVAYRNLAHLDKPINPTIEIVHSLYDAGYHILFCSGREETERDVTVNWLQDQASFYFDKMPRLKLFMRSEKDYREDSIIKREILHTQILPHYNVFAAFDDRKRVKKMWVQEGIFVFDVNQHDEEF